MIDVDEVKILTGCGDPISQARLRALSAPNAGDWLGTIIPLAACGLGLSYQLCNLKSPLEGEYSELKVTVRTEPHRWQETRWSHIGPMEERQIHSMGRNSLPHVRIVVCPPDVDSNRCERGASR